MRWPARWWKFAVGEIVALAASAVLAAEVLTPSASRQESATVSAEDVPSVDLDEIATEILETVHFELTKFDQVVHGAENWQGPSDASLKLDVSLTPTALYLEGDMADDYPFCQRLIRPAKPGWWKLSYGADGVVVTLEDPTSSSQRVEFALNWGSRAVDPRIDVIQSPINPRGGFARGACVELLDPVSSRGGSASSGTFVHFRAGVPVTELAETSFFEHPLVITVRMYDIDGDYASCSILEQRERLMRLPTGGQDARR